MLGCDENLEINMRPRWGRFVFGFDWCYKCVTPLGSFKLWPSVLIECSLILALKIVLQFLQCCVLDSEIVYKYATPLGAVSSRLRLVL